jgi:sugar lactone lactonase YvrE
LALVVVYLVAWPVPIEPASWNAPTAAGYSGAHARNERLSAMEFVAIGDAAGPEAIARDAAGRIYAAARDGKIVRLAPDGSAPTLWASTGGRPLGLAFDARGTLWVADGRRGLLAISPAGEVRVVTTEVAGTPIRLADDVDVAADGRVYFSDASTKFFAPRYSALEASLLEILEHVGTGRLLEYDPLTGLTRVLAEGFVFANGVAMSHDQRSVLLAETGSYRVLKITRDGERRGHVEPLIENLPGFPDNITRGRNGRYWISLVSPRNALVDRVSGSPFARRLIQRLPAFVRPKPGHYGHVIAVDDSGRVVADLQDPSGKLPMLTSALEVPGTPGYLYLGSLSAPTAARVPWPLP